MKKKLDLTTGSILLKLLAVAIPTLLVSLVQMTYNLTDLFWVGKVYLIGLDENVALSAVGTGGYYMWFGFGLILLVKIGTGIHIAQSAGSHDDKHLRTYANSGFVLMVLLGVFYFLVGFILDDFIIGLFRISNEEVIHYSSVYLRIISIGMISVFMINFFNSVYDALGLTIMTFLITASGLVLNMILDPLMILNEISFFGITIKGMGRGVEGAALATVIAQSTVLIIYIIIFISKRRPVTINPFRFAKKEDMKKILVLGFPSGLQSLFFTSIAIVIAAMLFQFDERVTAVQRLGSQIEAVAWMIASGFQVALSSFVGQNYGAREIERIKEGYYTSLMLLIPYGVVINISMFVLAKPIMGLFLVDPLTLDIGATYLRILSFSQLFMIVELGTQGAFNGVSKTIIPSGVGITLNALRIPFAYIFGFVLSYGYEAIWTTISISSILKGTILVGWFLWYYNNRIKYMNSRSEQII